ncbi:hypothetical protein E2986_04874, partial [Frieseomelitta varia]
CSISLQRCQSDICDTFSEQSSNITLETLGRLAITVGLLSPQALSLQSARNTSFYNKSKCILCQTYRPAAQLWKSVTSVSNAGKRRGRAKGLVRTRDLNQGQKIGHGKVGMLFPGLTAPIIQGEFTVRQRRLTEQEQQSNAPKIQPLVKPKRFKIHPLKRGWSGGQPDTFDGFESWILYAKPVSIMTSTMGRSKRVRSMVITGNRKGLAGFATVTGREFKPALNLAKNRAGLRLMYIERYNDHTVLHDFFSQFGKTKVFVKQKQKGYGLKCHRVIRTCCEAIGIKDLNAKVEGSDNILNIVKAFFAGLLRQKTFEEMANEKKLHLVEMRKENNYFPTVLASPPVVRSSKEIPRDEILDFKQYVMDGKVVLEKKRRNLPFSKLPSWQFHLRKKERLRNQDDVVIKLRAEYGDVCSFHAEKYPEARAPKWSKHGKKEEEEAVET